MPGLAEAFERIGEAAEHHLPLTHAAGIALAVTDPEETLGVVVRGFAEVASQAPVRPETRFQIGSISKQFAAICVLQEVEAGRLDLDVSVNELVPDLRLPEPFGPITLHHLMTHTAGIIIGSEESPTGPGALAILRGLQPTTAPGERFHYSNDGWKTVGAVLEQLTGMPAHDVVQQRVLGPLGMRSSEPSITNDTRLNLAVGYSPVYDDRPAHVNHPLAPAKWIVSNTVDGSIVSTVGDMAAYARVLLGRGRTQVGGHEVVLLGDDAFEELVRGRVDEGEDAPGARYGYGIRSYERDGHRYLEHTGGMVGFTAVLTVDVDAGLACVALQNGDGSKRELAWYGLAAVRGAIDGTSIVPAPHPPAVTEIAGAGELAGTYVGERTIELRATDDGLRLIDGPLGVALERWPETKDAFLVPHPSRDRFLLRVVRNDAGEVVELTHGPDRFAPEGRDLEPVKPVDPAWDGFAGVFRSNDPWGPVFRIFVRTGRLWMLWPDEGLEEPLVPLEDGWFGVTDPAIPRRLRFEEPIQGRPAVVRYNGGRWYRSFEG